MDDIAHPSDDLGSRRHAFVELLLDWSASNRRSFQWRDDPITPYVVAVAEALLQKTAAQNAATVFPSFIGAYPSVEHLAEAKASDVRRILQPLGLPRRADLLVAMAQAVIRDFGGCFPTDEKQLRLLPGVGPYGAAAIASLAGGQPAAMIDINVMRIVERVFSIPYTRRSGPTRQLRRFVGELLPAGRIPDFNLALVDFGALICTKRNPACLACRLRPICDFAQGGGGPNTLSGGRQESPAFQNTSDT